jgi:chromosome segregation ATPase
MSGGTGRRNGKEAIFAMPQTVEDSREIFGYLCETACDLLEEQRISQLRAYYLSFLQIERADPKYQEAELGRNLAYKKALEKLKETIEVFRRGLEQQVQDAVGVLQEKEAAADAEKTKYDAENVRLEKRAEQQARVHSGLEQRSRQLGEEQQRLQHLEAELKGRDDRLTGQESDYRQKRQKLKEALTYVSGLKGLLEKKGQEVYQKLSALEKSLAERLTATQLQSDEGAALTETPDEPSAQ